jgi:hypothetical protein
MPRLARLIFRNTAKLALCAGLLAMGRCTTRVIPPVDPVEPTRIYLCNYGIHSSLLLPLGDGRFVEYLYGDWKWAVLNQKGTLNGARAIFFSGQAALGRRYLTCAAGEKIPMPPEQPKITTVIVNGPGIREVIRELDARFARQNAYTFQQSMDDGGYLYVKDSVHYSVLHDCNSNTAEGLRKMGCTTVGMPVWSDFSVDGGRN